MNRLLVSLLAAFDAALAAAVGLVAALAPLTLLWVLGFGVGAPWDVLWSTSARVWQLGHLVPLTLTLPADYLAGIGLDPVALTFAFSLAPLAFAAFTAIFAARSGSRAASSGAWLTGVASGGVVFTAATTLVALTAANPVADALTWQAILFPVLVFVVPALLGALVTAWQVGDDGLIDDLRDRVTAWRDGWDQVPGLVARGGAIVIVGLIGGAAVLLAVTLILRGADIIALYQGSNVDVVGATVLTVGELVYLPTLVVWALSFLAGPGFAIGVGTSVSPSGTQVGVVPGLPILGLVPESTSTWLLLLALVPIALGAFAGWVARSQFVRVLPPRGPHDHDPIGARLVTAFGIAVLAAGATAVLTLAASGSLGPDRLAEAGPSPGPVALAVGLEVLVGAAILLLSPRSAADDAAPTDASEDIETSVTVERSHLGSALLDPVRTDVGDAHADGGVDPDAAPELAERGGSASADTDVLGRRIDEVSRGDGDRP